MNNPLSNLLGNNSQADAAIGSGSPLQMANSNHNILPQTWSDDILKGYVGEGSSKLAALALSMLLTERAFGGKQPPNVKLEISHDPRSFHEIIDIRIYNKQNPKEGVFFQCRFDPLAAGKVDVNQQPIDIIISMGLVKDEAAFNELCLKLKAAAA